MKSALLDYRLMKRLDGSEILLCMILSQLHIGELSNEASALYPE